MQTIEKQSERREVLFSASNVASSSAKTQDTDKGTTSSDYDNREQRIDRDNVEISMWNNDLTKIITKHAKVTVNIKWLD